MPIEEAKVAAVVADVSARMSDPSYAQSAIAAFIAAHPEASRFVAMKVTRSGGSEAAMHALFHAEVVAECVRREYGTQELPSLGFADLDAVATKAPLDALNESEPAIAGYIESNIDGSPMRAVVAHVALALMNRPLRA